MPYMGDISMCKDKHKTDHVFLRLLKKSKDFI